MPIDKFCSALAKEELSELEKSVALIWFYTDIEKQEDCSISEIISTFDKQRFPKPNPSRLRKNIKATPATVLGKRPDSFRISRSHHDIVEERYSEFLNRKKVIESESIIPLDWVTGKRRSYLENMAKQINGCFELGYYDSCAVILRRMMESLIIDVYLKNGREAEIKKADKTFIGLEDLIKKLPQDFTVNKNLSAQMKSIKEIGDTAAHHRSYTTVEADIDTKAARKVIHELLLLLGLIT